MLGFVRGPATSPKTNQKSRRSSSFDASYGSSPSRSPFGYSFLARQEPTFTQQSHTTRFRRASSLESVDDSELGVPASFENQHHRVLTRVLSPKRSRHTSEARHNRISLATPLPKRARPKLQKKKALPKNLQDEIQDVDTSKPSFWDRMRSKKSINIPSTYFEQIDEDIKFRADKSAVPLMDKQLSKGMRKTIIMNEILLSERAYVNELDKMLRHIINPLKACCIRVYPHPTKDVIIMFDQIKPLFDLHSRFLRALEASRGEVGATAQAFADFIPFFRLYSQYATEFVSQRPFIEELMTLDKYRVFKFTADVARDEAEMMDVSLREILRMPIQRMTQYVELLLEITKNLDRESHHYYHVKKALLDAAYATQGIDIKVRQSKSQVKLLKITKMYDVNPDFMKAGRFLIGQGTLAMVLEAGNEEVFFFVLFNDQLTWSAINKNKLRLKGRMPITAGFAVEIVPPQFRPHAFRIIPEDKSHKKVVLVAKSEAVQLLWIEHIKECVEKASMPTIPKDSVRYGKGLQRAMAGSPFLPDNPAKTYRIERKDSAEDPELQHMKEQQQFVDEFMSFFMGHDYVKDRQEMEKKKMKNTTRTSPKTTSPKIPPVPQFPAPEKYRQSTQYPHEQTYTYPPHPPHPPRPPQPTTQHTQPLPPIHQQQIKQLSWEEERREFETQQLGLASQAIGRDNVQHADSLYVPRTSIHRRGKSNPIDQTPSRMSIEAEHTVLDRLQHFQGTDSNNKAKKFRTMPAPSSNRGSSRFSITQKSIFEEAKTEQKSEADIKTLKVRFIRLEAEIKVLQVTDPDSREIHELQGQIEKVKQIILAKTEAAHQKLKQVRVDIIRTEADLKVYELTDANSEGINKSHDRLRHLYHVMHQIEKMYPKSTNKYGMI